MTANYIRRNLAAGRRPNDFYAHHTLRRTQLTPHPTALFVCTIQITCLFSILFLALGIIVFLVRRAYKKASKYVTGKLTDYEETRSSITRAANMNVKAGKIIGGLFGFVKDVSKTLPVPVPAKMSNWFMKGREAERARAREEERRKLFDHRYGWVDSLGETSRFDGANSARSGSVVDGVGHPEEYGIYYGTNIVRKRSLT